MAPAVLEVGDRALYRVAQDREGDQLDSHELRGHEREVARVDPDSRTPLRRQPGEVLDADIGDLHVGIELPVRVHLVSLEVGEDVAEEGPSPRLPYLYAE